MESTSGSDLWSERSDLRSERSDLPVHGPVSIGTERAFAVQMVLIYNGAAGRQFSEAEDLVARAIELRESGMSLLARAVAVANEYAVAVDAHEETLSEAINW